MIKLAGHLRKMVGVLRQPIAYHLPIGEQRLLLNEHLGKKFQFHYSGEIHCISCGRRSKKSYNQGYCYPCFRDLAECDLCIVTPERCHFDAGTCRDPAWGEQHCMAPHIVYLANSAGIKVGITRLTQVPTRWIDQGAEQAVAIFQVQTRYQSGLLEVALKQYVNDRTNWRKMLQAEAATISLEEHREKLIQQIMPELAEIKTRFGEQAITPLAEAQAVSLHYPVQQYPKKITSLNFDRAPQWQGILQGIKGQYLIFDCGVLNIRKFAGYHIELTVT